MSADVYEIPNWLGCRGSGVSIGDTDEKTIEAGVSNDTVSEGGTVSDIVMKPVEKNMIQTQRT